MPLITFDYPITDFKTKQHVGDLRIIAMAVLYSDKKIAGVQVMKVMSDNKDILRIIRAISPDEWEAIEAAANSHAEGIWTKDEHYTDSLKTILQPKEKIS